MIDDEKLLTDKAEDLKKSCLRRCQARFSQFLDGAQQVLIAEKCYFNGFNMRFFGGVEECERKILGVFPEWEEPTDFPIVVLEISHSFGGELSHRDYLGSILGLGIERSKTGDILINGNTAYAFVMEDIASYIADNLKKIGSRGVKIKIKKPDDVVIPEKKFIEINTVCASQRLDAVVGAALNISRSKSVELISGGMVKVNHMEADNSSKQLDVGDLLSVRGYGRFIISEIGNKTRKDRIHILLKKYA